MSLLKLFPMKYQRVKPHKTANKGQTSQVTEIVTLRKLYQTRNV